jgi:hypothetical protein
MVGVVYSRRRDTASGEELDGRRRVGGGRLGMGRVG